jgi:predicted esterase
MTFDDLYHQLQRDYQNGEYAQALERATQALEAFPAQRTVLDYWRMTMAARIGETALALDIFQEALDLGEWFSELLLRRSPSFKALQAEPLFERLVALNQDVAESDHAREFPMLTLRPQERCKHDGPPCPLLMGLHGHATTVQTALGFWAPAAASGWLVAAPQSSQAIWKGAYVWDNREIAETEVQRHFAALRGAYAVDATHTVMAGHSTGGEVAIWLALRNTIAMRGFLAIGPGGPMMDDPDEWTPLLRSGAPPDLRGAVIIGKEDATTPHENIYRLVEQLNEAGVETYFEVVPDVGHEHELEYDPAILRALAFITE